MVKDILFLSSDLTHLIANNLMMINKKMLSIVKLTLFMTFVSYHLPSVEMACELLTETLFCQATFFTQFSNARAEYAKSQLVANKFYVSYKLNYNLIYLK